MRPLNDLTDLIAEFPGVGPRQARRIVQFLLSKNKTFRARAADLIQKVGDHLTRCNSCFRFDEVNESGMCAICVDPARDTTALMVVEKDVDIESVEAAHAYSGRYFVLGGLIPMAKQRRNGSAVRIKELLARIAKSKKNGLREVVLALSTTPEGDYTALETAKNIVDAEPGMKVTLLGRGLSTGAELEYADRETLRNALKNRA